MTSTLRYRLGACAALFTALGVLSTTATATALPRASSGKTYELKYTGPDPTGEPQTAGLLHFAKLVAADSRGQIDVKTYINGILASSSEGITLVQNGSAQMSYGNAPDLASYVPTYDFLQEPLLFTNQSAVLKGLASPAMKAVDNQLLAKSGVRVLAWETLGFIDLLNKEHPIRSASDMKGLSFRVIPGSAPVTSAMQTLGAQAVPLDITETYTALEQGTVEGNEDPVPTFYPSKQWEVAKYLTIMPFQYNPAPVVINNKFFESLPKGLQKIVQKDATKTASWEIALENRDAVQDVTLMKKAGVHVNTLSASGLASFKKALAPQRAQAIKTYGASLARAFGVS